MSKDHHILVPTDGSENALKAAEYAGDLARALDAKVSVLIVHDERLVVAEAWSAATGEIAATSDAGTVETVRSATEQQAEQNALADTRSALGDVAAGVELQQVWGHPVDDICRYADEHDVDQIVMGSHGRGLLKRAFLGSVSNAVANSANCVVTIVK